jgi:Mn-dependent DtxR family transcriptional regulator
MQIQFYYHSGDYIAVTDLYRLLGKCTSTPDLMLRKLIDLGVITMTDKQNVVQLK